VKFACLLGIPIRVNPLFLLLAILYSCLGLGREIIIILAAVFLHEIAHTLVALMLGIKVAEIEILPFGGQAQIEDFTGLDPGKEIYLALAGPAVSLLLAGLFYFLQPYLNVDLRFFVNINLLLGLFNLLPALPLDGGRVFRALISPLLGFKRSTKIAAFLGQLIALLLFAYGFYLSYTRFTGANYIAIGVLLFWAARREGKLLLYSFMRYLINKKAELARKGFLSCNQLVAYTYTPVKEILNAAGPSYYLVVVVLDEKHHPRGMISEVELIECYLEKGPRVSLEDCQ